MGSAVEGIFYHNQHILDVQAVTSGEKSLNTEMLINGRKNQLDGWQSFSVVSIVLVEEMMRHNKSLCQLGGSIYGKLTRTERRKRRIFWSSRAILKTHRNCIPTRQLSEEKLSFCAETFWLTMGGLLTLWT